MRDLHPDAEDDFRLWLPTPLRQFGPDGAVWRRWEEACGDSRNAILTPDTDTPTVAVLASGGPTFAVHICNTPDEEPENS